MKLEIFLCYAREDEEPVKTIYQRLTDAGFKPWMDTMDLLCGEAWEIGIERAIRRADIFLACLSSNSIKKRGFVQKELTRALDILKEKLDEDIYIIPVRLDDCEVPEGLRSLTWVNYFHDTGWVRLNRSLEVAVARHVMPIAPLHDSSSKPSNAVAPVAADNSEPSQNRTVKADESHRDDRQLQTANKINEAGRESRSTHVSQWDVELQKVLNGEREDEITRFGQVSEYIEAILTNSDDLAGSQLDFQEALRQLIKEQSPYRQLSERYIVRLLDLISVYLPSDGSHWVLNFIKHKGRSAGNNASGVIEETSNDIHLSALMTLENYFPVAPVGRPPAFEEYVNVLRWEMTQPQHCGYAAGRLIELDILQPGDDDVLLLIERAPQCLHELVPLLLTGSRRSRLSQDFSRIYSHCLLSSNNIQQVLDEVLNAVGASVQLSHKGPMLVIDKAKGTIEVVYLDLPERAMHGYFEKLLNTETKLGLQKLMAAMG